VYSCCGSECKELLAGLGGRAVAQALDDAALAVALTKFRQRVPQLFDVLEYPDPQYLPFQPANEPFDTAVAFRLAGSVPGGRRGQLESAGSHPGDPRVELVEPVGPDSPVEKFLERGSGLHHLCYEVDNLDDAVQGGSARGLVMIRRHQPAVAFGGRRIAWFLTRERLLIEYLERACWPRDYRVRSPRGQCRVPSPMGPRETRAG